MLFQFTYRNTILTLQVVIPIFEKQSLLADDCPSNFFHVTWLSLHICLLLSCIIFFFFISFFFLLLFLYFFLVLLLQNGKRGEWKYLSCQKMELRIGPYLQQSFSAGRWTNMLCTYLLPVQIGAWTLWCKSIRFQFQYRLNNMTLHK